MKSSLVLALMASAVLGLAAGPHYGAWSVPENLGSVVNSEFDDYGGALSKDGLSLYFTSNRIGPVGQKKWLGRVATRRPASRAAKPLSEMGRRRLPSWC